MTADTHIHMRCATDGRLPFGRVVRLAMRHARQTAPGHVRVSRPMRQCAWFSQSALTLRGRGAFVAWLGVRGTGVQTSWVRQLVAPQALTQRDHAANAGTRWRLVGKALSRLTDTRRQRWAGQWLGRRGRLRGDGMKEMVTEGICWCRPVDI